MTVSKGGNSVRESVKALDPTSDKMAVTYSANADWSGH
jgi:hypothetical protein